MSRSGMAIIARAHSDAPDHTCVTDIYIDESSQTKNRFLLIGGIGVPKSSVDAVNEILLSVRLPELPHGEMKWGKISNAKINAYGRLIRSFFDHPLLAPLHFHCLIVDTHRLDHQAHNQGSREIGFNKEIYQLASKFARLYPDRLFHLYPDHRETLQRPEDLRVILNRGRAKAGDRREFPFRRCQFRNSKETPLLQLVDLLTGAVAWNVNGHGQIAGASQAKDRISRYVLKLAKVRDCTRSTSMTGKFTIWHRELRKASPGTSSA